MVKLDANIKITTLYVDFFSIHFKPHTIIKKYIKDVIILITEPISGLSNLY